MRRAIRLAKLGAGYTAPNPLVGAVVVSNDLIIGEGWHHRYGEAHAEVNAIADVKDTSLLLHSTLFVTLEPCNHQGKTPPCTELILASGIPRVVVGMQDPNPLVAGAGIQRLRDAGVAVVVGVEEKAARALNAGFVSRYERNRPYILLKWAQSEDGFIGRPNEKVWISNRITGLESHRLRSLVQAILIAENTARLDDPMLTNRDWYGTTPARIILDRRGDLPDHLHVFDGQYRSIIFTYNADRTYKNAEKILLQIGKPVAGEICDELIKLNIQTLLVEGGSSILKEFIEADLWDEARIYVAPQLLEHGVKAPVIPLVSDSVVPLGDNKRIYYKNPLWK